MITTNKSTHPLIIQVINYFDNHEYFVKNYHVYVDEGHVTAFKRYEFANSDVKFEFGSNNSTNGVLTISSGAHKVQRVLYAEWFDPQILTEHIAGAVQTLKVNTISDLFSYEPIN